MNLFIKLVAGYNVFGPKSTTPRSIHTYSWSPYHLSFSPIIIQTEEHSSVKNRGTQLAKKAKQKHISHLGGVASALNCLNNSFSTSSET